MGIFHKSLKDAKHYVENGELDRAMQVFQAHYDQHISEEYNGQLYRLHKYIGDYREKVAALIKEVSDKQRFSDIRFNTLYDETEHNLKRIKSEIKKLLDTERVKLE